MSKLKKRRVIIIVIMVILIAAAIGTVVYKINEMVSAPLFDSGIKQNSAISKRVISLSNVRLLLATGKTSKIEGFVSKNGREFSATLRLENDGNITFDFS